MSRLIANTYCDHTIKTNERNMCVLDNITTIPMYHIQDSLSYLVSRCNYCGKEWDEFWISYRYIFSSLIYRHQHQEKQHTLARISVKKQLGNYVYSMGVKNIQKEAIGTMADIESNFAITIIGMTIVYIVLMGLPIGYMLAKSFGLKRKINPPT